ncbi:MAG: ASPIC/UnbV domain-containing protein, partial [Thermoanaerobaculia bacterium]|nr:ASPIC/UnbV domain-containing protein [Thermoanaerobaculia bacterium]
GDLAEPIVGRGAAYADVDGDGDLDVVLTQSGGRPVLLRNDQALGHHWLRVRLEGNGTSSNRDAVGALVELAVGDRTLRRGVTPARSYQAQVELPVTFGLGAATTVGELRVTWPDGATSAHAVEGVDRLLVLRQP